jgi:hypothetical protein
MLINKLLSCLEGDNVKIGIFGDRELAIYVGEEEIPVSVMLWRDSYEIYIDVEGYAFQLTTEQILKLGVVMSLLSEEESITEMRGWVEGIE